MFFFIANPMLFWLSSHMSLWSKISFYFAIVINILVASYYPFSNGAGGRRREQSINQSVKISWRARKSSCIVNTSFWMFRNLYY